MDPTEYFVQARSFFIPLRIVMTWHGEPLQGSWCRAQMT